MFQLTNKELTLIPISSHFIVVSAPIYRRVFALLMNTRIKDQLSVSQRCADYESWSLVNKYLRSREYSFMFNRPPRIRKSRQDYVVKIPSPVQLPAKPKINWLTIGLPLVGIGLAIGLMALISNGSVLSYLMFLPLMVASVLAGVINHFVQQKEYNKSVIEEIKNYSLVLDEKEAELKRCFSEQKAALFETDPDLPECYRRAKEKDECLGERRPSDDDFLSFRVGVGNQDSGIEIDVPPGDKRETLFTDLFIRADKFKQTFYKYSQ